MGNSYEICAHALVANKLGEQISIGGAVGLAVQVHVARIAKYRPLEKISDPAARASAARVRTWFRTECLDALS